MLVVFALLPWPGPSGTAAAGPALAACCQAVGGGACPDTLKVTGSASSQVVSPQGTLVTGLWTLQCDAGASWMAADSQTTANPFPPSTVLTPLMPAAGACFDASCRLPEGTCVRFDGKRLFLASCAGGAPATDLQLQNPPRVPRGAVVVGGRVLGSSPVPGGAGVAAARPVPSPANASTGPVDASLPPQPPEPCKFSAALREPSNEQVDAGNDAIVGGDFATALDRYRAAITINKCNAFAWAALGDALLQSGNPTPARGALEVATRLMPTNHHAWATLGQAAERAGDRAGAATAFRKALEARPGYAPAAEGLARVQ